jgi:hexokinase
MSAMPDGFLEQIKQLEDVFTVDAAKLKQIVNHFVKELEKGEAESHCAIGDKHPIFTVCGSTQRLLTRHLV